MKKRFLSMILAVVLCGLLLAGCDGGGSTGTVSPAPEAPAASAGVVSIKLLGASWEKKMDGYTYVYYSAELSNGNSKTAGACQITVTSRDAEGHVLDVSNDYTGRIAGNDTIRFSGRVMYVGDACTTSYIVWHVCRHNGKWDAHPRYSAGSCAVQFGIAGSTGLECCRAENC